MIGSKVDDICRPNRCGESAVLKPRVDEQPIATKATLQRREHVEHQKARYLRPVMMSCFDQIDLEIEWFDDRKCIAMKNGKVDFGICDVLT